MPASASKTPVDEPTVRAVVVDALGPDAELAGFAELTDGWFNAVYDLQLADGRRLVLKVAPPPGHAVQRYERDLLAAEVAAIELVLARTRAPAPEVVHVDRSCTLVTSPYALLDFLPGTSLHAVRAELDDERRARIDAELAGYLREMHTVTGDAFGLLAPGQRAHATWPAAFADLVDMALADAADRAVALPRDADALRALVAGGGAALAEVTTPRLVHWDLWDGNVLVDPVAGRVTGVFDFERALWGDPLMEVQFRPLVEPPGFVAAYGRSLLDTPAAVHRRRLYNVYLYLQMIVEGAYRHYDDDALERWARLRLDEELDALAALAASGGGGADGLPDG